MNITISKALRTASLFLLFFLFIALPVQASAPLFGDEDDTVMLRGRVISVEDLEPDESVSGFVELQQVAVVEITRGPYRGQQHTLVNELMNHPYYDTYLTEGMQLLLWGQVDESGTVRKIFLQGVVRDTYLYIIVIIFIVSLLIVGRFKGLLTVITLSVTVAAVALVLLPMLLRGYAPIPTTLLVASLITVFTLVGISGLRRKTAAAAIGTVGGVFVAGLLALWAGNAARLTGFSSEEAQMLLYMEGGPIDVRGLLFAGIIIGALGAVMDLAMSIAAASHEVYCANPAICMREQIKSSMNVGRDVMGTMANTLILAYVGTSMPLLLLFMGYATPMGLAINYDLVATEVVRALTGSIGIVAAVPLTAIAAGVLTVRKDAPTDKTLN
jgi:uncharacterized membrane protein